MYDVYVNEQRKVTSEDFVKHCCNYLATKCSPSALFSIWAWVASTTLEKIKQVNKKIKKVNSPYSTHSQALITAHVFF